MDIELIRKAASAESGRQFLENYGQVDFGHVSLARMRKAANADTELLKIAAWCSEDSDTLEMYELLGGDYEKRAFGVPMFDMGASKAGGTPVGGPKLGGPVGPGTVKPPAQGGGLQTPKAPGVPSVPSIGRTSQ